MIPVPVVTEVGTLACHETNNKKFSLVPGVKETCSLSCHKVCNKMSLLVPGVKQMCRLACHEMCNKMSPLAPGVKEMCNLAFHKVAYNKKSSSLVPGVMEVGSLACHKMCSKQTASSARNSSHKIYPCHHSYPWGNATRYGLFPQALEPLPLTRMGLILTSSTLQHALSSSHMNRKEGRASLASAA